MERPKMGFAIPVGKWIRGSMKEWAEGLINKKEIEEGGYFNAKAVDEFWHQHSSGKINRTYELWNILMFQAWLRKN
jgi:asparagine synthase (glutamine-hydrolysing)